MNPDQAAERYADPAMSATVLMNIEANRRRTPVTVDELVQFAHVYDVPVEALLLPLGDRPVQVALGVTVEPARFLRWMRGEQPLDGTDAKLYEAAATAVASAGQSAIHELRDEFLTRATAAFDMFFAGSEEMTRKTRQQMRDVLSEVREAAAAGTPADELLTVIDGYLDRLQ